MTTATKYTAAEKKLAARLSKAANEEGTIQAHAMLKFTSRPEWHTTMSVARAFSLLSGKEYDTDYFAD